MFNHKPVDIPEVSTKNINRKRFYDTPTGFYPSITTVLGVRKEKKAGLQAWRNRVGNDVANHIMRTAASRGTAVHTMCEDFLNNKEVLKEEFAFLPWCLFSQLKPTLEKRIDNIYAQEKPLYSDHLGLAGTVDVVGEFDEKLSIIDFKTSRQSMIGDKYGKLEKYFRQAAGYAVMFEERYKFPINSLVIIAAVAGKSEPEVFTSKRDTHIGGLIDMVKEYKQHHNQL